MQITLCYWLRKKRCYRPCTINTLHEIGRCCGMEVNVETIKVMRISIRPSPVYNVTDQNNCSMWNISTTRVAWQQMMQDVHVKLNQVLSWKKQYSTRRRLFTNKLDLNLRKKLIKCYIWSITLWDAETWTLRKVDQKYLESFEIWRRRSMVTSWIDRVRNEVQLNSVITTSVCATSRL